MDSSKQGTSVQMQQNTSRVISVRRVSHGATTYDIEVSNRHRFYANRHLVNNCIGVLSPHGDVGTKVAMDTLVNQGVPTMLGKGNWGGITSTAGAMRYINAGFNNYGRSFFVPDYLAVVPRTPNYDGSTTEPLYLPALLPNLLLNANEGIGVGIRTSIPAFTPESLLPVMAAMLRGTKFSPAALAKKLVFSHPYGGRVLKTPTNLENIQKLFEGTTGKVAWVGEYSADFAKKEIILLKYPPGFDPVKVVDEKIKLIEDVDRVGAGKGVSYVIRVNKNCNLKDFEAVVVQIKKMLTVTVHYYLYVTERKIRPDSDDEYDVLFHNLTIHQMMVKWLKGRIRLEADSLDYRIEKVSKAIHLMKLLRFAALNLDKVKYCLEQKDAAAAMVKVLKISIEDANVLLDRKLRNLSRLDQDKIAEKLQGAINYRLGLTKRREDPKEEVAKFLEDAATQFEQYERWSGTHQRNFKRNLITVKVESSSDDSSESEAENTEE